LQGFNKKTRKHIILYDSGEKELLNLATTARKWELDDSKEASAKATASAKAQAEAKVGIYQVG